MDREIKRDGYTIIKIKDGRPVVPVVAIGDLHFGSRNHDPVKLTKVLAWAQTNGALIILIGDLIENANKASIGAGVYEQVVPPQEQINRIIEILKPFVPQIIGAVKGNHEERTYKSTGIDPMKGICDTLNVPYCGWELFALITTDKHDGAGCAYSIYAVHSYSGNKSAGLALNWSENNIGTWIGNIDIVMRAHSHDLGFDVSPWMHLDTKNVHLTQRNRYYLMTGHYMTRPDSYIAASAGKAKPAGTVALWLTMDRKHRGVKPEYLL